MNHIDMNLLTQWQGRTESTSDIITAYPVKALQATLETPYVTEVEKGTALPPLWHWLYFLPLHGQSSLGSDGHAQKGGFLPPVPLPRRMWAGGRFGFFQPLRVGETVHKTSTIQSIKSKSGRTGHLVFVTVRHEFSVDGQLRLWEEHDIVYREAPQENMPSPEPITAPTGAWQREIQPDDVLLFRYSALTFNGHRIHYDRRYVTEIEGYPGLIVHGPLIATLLLDLLQRQQPQAQISEFSFKAIRPTFDISPFFVNGNIEADGQSFHLWANDSDGYLTMDATVKIAEMK